MKKLMCAKCGGKKMANGGSTKLAAAGIPYASGAGQTDGKIGTMKKGGKVVNRKKVFPDLTGDGKVTMKDVLKGRGVIKKRGGMVKRK
jgi:hypothetical protein